MEEKSEIPCEMVERVAGVLMKSDWAVSDEPKLKHYYSAARAAITAMREPTAAMIFEGIGRDGLNETWAAMIDAALAE